MGCGASVPLGPRRIDLQDEAGVPAWRCATIVSRTKEQAKLQIDGTADLLDAKLPEEFDSASRHAVHPTPATTLSLNVSDRTVTARLGKHVHYDPGQRLLVVLAEGVLAHAEVVVRAGRVGNRFKLRRVGDPKTRYEVDLNPNNHAASRFEAAEAYTEACRTYLDLLVKELGEVEDAITGNRLKVEEQLIYITADARAGAAGRGITGVQRKGWRDATDMQSLATLLAAPSLNRHQGTHEAQGVLMLAGPGTGKTWSTQQLAYLLARTAQEAKGALPLLPLLVPVQRMLAVLKRAQIDVAGRPQTLLVEFIKEQYAEAPPTRDALLQAYDLRQLVVILDGADEAAALRVRAASHAVAKRSAPRQFTSPHAARRVPLRSWCSRSLSRCELC